MAQKLLLLALQVVLSRAYPYFANGYTADQMKELKPGDDFLWGYATKMHIDKYEAEYDDNCVIVTDIPEQGFEEGKGYSITVTSNTDGGVGNVVITSGGEFDNEDQDDTYLSSQKQSVATGYRLHASMTYKWKSPIGSAMAEFYGICSNGDGKKAWLAKPLALPMKAPVLPAAVAKDIKFLQQVTHWASPLGQAIELVEFWYLENATNATKVV